MELRRMLLSLMMVLGVMSFALGQSPGGEISGRILDHETKEGLPFANLVLEKNGVQVQSTTSDFDGSFVFESVIPGTYDLSCSYMGYKSFKTEGLVVKGKGKLEVDIKLEPSN